MCVFSGEYSIRVQCICVIVWSKNSSLNVVERCTNVTDRHFIYFIEVCMVVCLFRVNDYLGNCPIFHDLCSWRLMPFVFLFLLKCTYINNSSTRLNNVHDIRVHTIYGILHQITCWVSVWCSVGHWLGPVFVTFVILSINSGLWNVNLSDGPYSNFPINPDAINIHMDQSIQCWIYIS